VRCTPQRVGAAFCAHLCLEVNRRAVYHAQDAVAELKVVRAGPQTNKPLLGSANDWSHCGKIDPRKNIR
jgi:hypothetical protein